MAKHRQASPLLTKDAERNFNGRDTSAIDEELLDFTVYPPREPGHALFSRDALVTLEDDLVTPERAQRYGRSVGRQLMKAVESSDDLLAEELAAPIVESFANVVHGESKKESFRFGIGEGIEDVVVEQEGIAV